MKYSIWGVVQGGYFILEEEGFINQQTRLSTAKTRPEEHGKTNRATGLPLPFARRRTVRIMITTVTTTMILHRLGHLHLGFYYMGFLLYVIFITGILQ